MGVSGDFTLNTFVFTKIQRWPPCDVIVAIFWKWSDLHDFGTHGLLDVYKLVLGSL